MADANFVAQSFLGGEWSKFAQGRADNPDYRRALTRCLNTVPIEEGAAVRRPGTQRLYPTYLRSSAKLLPFLSSTACAFATEVTTNGSGAFLRYFNGALPIFTNDARLVATSSYDPDAAELTLGLDTTHGWSVGDQFLLSFPAGFDPTKEAGCRGRVMEAVGASGSTLILGDDLGDRLILPTPFPAAGLVGASIFRFVRSTGPWTTDLENLRLVQAQLNGIILSAEQPPQTLTVVDSLTAEPIFTVAATAFQDGPYNDPQPDTGTVSAYTGSITFTPASSTFVATDVGRMIRLFSQPPAWASGTTYTAGNTVTYNNTYWVALNSGPYTNVGVIPGTNFTAASGIQVVLWAPAPQEGQWAWGKITAQAGSSCTVALTTNLNSHNGTTIAIWRLGLFQAGSYPTCGVYHEGRLWLAGATPNRFDGGSTDGTFIFSPTDQFGVVNDDNAIDYTLNAKELNNILWMSVDQQGIIAGTLGGEFLISATNLSDPLTPTSIQAHQTTNYGSLNAEPRRVGISLSFIQRYGRRVMEFLSDTFSGKFSGKHINERAKHLSVSGIAEIQYQEESAPVIWARTNLGQLIGCTYRRVSRFVTEDPVFQAWHQHVTGGAYPIGSMCVLPAVTGLDDRLYMTSQGPGSDWFIEMLRPFPEVEDGTLEAWFSDHAPGVGVNVPPKCGVLIPSIGASVPAGYVISSPDTPITGDRAIIAPGSTPTLPTGGGSPSATNKARAQFLGFNTNETVLFDGVTAMYGVPVPASGNSVSISFWMAADGPAQGTILCSPYVSGSQNNVEGFFVGPMMGAGSNTSLLPKDMAYDLGGFSPFSPAVDNVWDLLQMVAGVGGKVALNQHMFTPTKPGAYVHVMIGLTAASNNLRVVVYYNDTQALDIQLPNDGGFLPKGTWTGPGVFNPSLPGGGNSDWSPGSSTDGQRTPIVIPWGDLKDGGDPATGSYSTPIVVPSSSPNVWSIGGAVPARKGDNPSQPNGNGLLGGVTELWIKLGSFVDWTNGTNRAKFHTRDINGVYVPVNIGVHGETPTGSKPSVYCTGGPNSFSVNRANGHGMKVFGGSGETIFVPKVGEVAKLNSDDRFPGSA